MQVVGRIRSSYALQVHKVTSGEDVHKSLSRRDVNFPCSLPRRDVDLLRRDVNFTCLCHVATWIHTSRRQFLLSLPRRDENFYKPLSRRDVAHHVATLVSTISVTSRRHPARRDVTLHVATSPRTSRRQFLWASVTSRRDPARRDVFLFLSLEQFILALHLVHPITRNPSLLAHLHSLALPELSVMPAGGLYIAFRPPLCIPECSSNTGSGSLLHFHHIVLESSLRAFSMV